MAATKWFKPNSVATILAAADLNSIANAAAALSAAYDNTTNLDLYADFVLAIQYNAGPPAAGTKVAELYLEAAVDGTNYPSVGSSLPQKSLLIATFESRAPSTSALEYLDLYGIPILPLNQKFRLYNTSGQTLHASASMFLKMSPYQLQTA